MGYAIGVDIGGTKIASALIDEKGSLLYRKELPSISTDRELLFEQVVLCIQEVLQSSGHHSNDLVGIGLGVPGKVDCENGIAVFQNNIKWGNFPLVERIKNHFTFNQVVIDNDVYMAAFAEWMTSGGNIDETFLYLTISTGVSCCTIHNGDVIRGAGFAGEVGFLPVSSAHPITGKSRNLEAIASGEGIRKLAVERKSPDIITSSVNSKQVIEAYNNGEDFESGIMDEVFNSLAKGLYSISCLLDPNKLILGGGVINHNPQLLKPIKKALQNYLVSYQIDILNRISVSQLKGDAGLIGAGLKVQSHKK